MLHTSEKLYIFSAKKLRLENYIFSFQSNNHYILFRISLNHCMLLFDKFKLFNLNLEAIQIGPATVHMYFKSFMGKQY